MKLPRTQQALLEAMREGVVIHQCWTRGTGMFYFRHDNMRACTAAGLALVSKGLARTEGSGTDKYLVLIDDASVAAAAESPQSTSHVS